MSNIFYNIEPKVINTQLACLIGLNEAIVLQQLHYWIEKNKATATNFRDCHYWTYGTLQEYTDRDFPFWSMDTVRRTITKLISLGFVVRGNYNKMKMDKTSWYAIDYVALDTWIAKKATNNRRTSPSHAQSDIAQFPTMQNANMESDICQMQHGNMQSSHIADSHVRALQNANTEDGKISTSSMADCNAPSVQSATLEDDNLPSAIQEIIPEIKKEINYQRLDEKTNTQKAVAPTACESVPNKNTHSETAYDGVIIEPVELLFDEFWKLYPRKESKQQAKKAWMKLKPDQNLFILIANALEYRRQTKEWISEGGRYIPHPATWLNGRRWEDELGSEKFSEATVFQEKYGDVSIDGKPLDPVQRKQLEYIEKQMQARQNNGEVQ
jgi:hypothetical protein